MKIIQIILILIFSLILIQIYILKKKQKISKLEYLIWSIFWGCGILVSIYPDITGIISQKIGIGRGSDLVIYIALIILFWMNFKILLRIERIEKDITKIVREKALKSSKD